MRKTWLNGNYSKFEKKTYILAIAINHKGDLKKNVYFIKYNYKTFNRKILSTKIKYCLQNSSHIYKCNKDKLIFPSGLHRKYN